MGGKENVAVRACEQTNYQRNVGERLREGLGDLVHVCFGTGGMVAAMAASDEGGGVRGGRDLTAPQHSSAPQV
jgi:hypothetical protein